MLFPFSGVFILKQMSSVLAVNTPGSMADSFQNDSQLLSKSKAEVLRENMVSPIYHSLVPDTNLREMSQHDAYMAMIKMRFRHAEAECHLLKVYADPAQVDLKLHLEMDLLGFEQVTKITASIRKTQLIDRIRAAFDRFWSHLEKFRTPEGGFFLNFLRTVVIVMACIHFLLTRIFHVFVFQKQLRNLSRSHCIHFLYDLHVFRYSLHVL